MPRGDGTGPGGMGPMTGRAAGYCTGYTVPGFMNATPGFGQGAGWGGGMFRGGRGRRNSYYATGLPTWARGAAYPPASPYGVPPVPYGAPMQPTQEKEALKNQAAYLEGMLNDIKGRIDELQSESEPEEK